MPLIMSSIDDRRLRALQDVVDRPGVGSRLRSCAQNREYSRFSSTPALISDSRDAGMPSPVLGAAGSSACIGSL